MENILGTSSPPGLAKREVAKDLMVVVGEEPATADKAKHDKEWRVVMLDKMAPIEQNKT